MATDLDAVRFADFFSALWDKKPFAWQEELAQRVLGRADSAPDRSSSVCSSNGNRTQSPWPETIALPTASGKTACLDIAVFALAAQASRLAAGKVIAAPRRIFFVVDRRVIVDEAHERARRLAEKLKKAKSGILKTVADNLRRIAHGETAGFESEQPLSVHVLRGGMYRSEAWARNPLQPTVVASTVDQIGSRLLFRAYGRGFGTWPIYAGLIANDSLILLDEAHCAQPFLQTLQAVERFRTWAHAPLERSFHAVILSATPPAGSADVFEDQSSERRDPEHPLGRRQLARKPAVLKTVNLKNLKHVNLKKTKGARSTSVLAKELTTEAIHLVSDQRRAVVVFVNRVATARETWRLLRDREDIQSLLLTGRIRAIDKDAIVRERLMPLHSSQSEHRSLPKPLIVVATQTLEVGADLDFDGLVTECASLDALRQRFGRLNRMGRDIEARAAILIRSDQTDEKEDDPIYGKALARTWAWLTGCKNEEGKVDFGIAHLDRQLLHGLTTGCQQLLKSLNAVLNAPSPDAPVMLPAHVDCWAQTAPAPLPSPDVAPFLRGPREGAADVQVCWRADLELENDAGRKNALESLSLCPPSSNESLPVPIGAFRQWLAGADAEDDSADVEGAAPDDNAEPQERHQADRAVVRWRGAETKRADITSDSAAIRPGDVIVIPVSHPGEWNRLGDVPPDSAKPIEALDVGDQAYRLARAKPVLRLHPKLVAAWPDCVAGKSATRELLNDLETKYEDDPDEIAEAVRELLHDLANHSEPLPERWSWLSETASELKKEFAGAKLRRECRIVGRQNLILVGRRRIPKLAHEADSFSDEDDASASGISHRNGKPVRLRAHLPGVADFACRHAAGCGLPPEMTQAITRAGLLHDLGKADPRFQSMLRGGARLLGSELLAKSATMPQTRTARDRARKESGYPQGGRHELLSVRLAESAPAILPEQDELRDLALHLIASHHGHCRPFAPVVFDAQPASVEFELCGQRMQWYGPTGLERLDSGVAERYWRLVRRYGWWGLAWLETLLRLADWRRSEWEETHDGE